MATVETIFNTETKIQILRTLSYSERAYSAEDLEKVTTKEKTAIYNAIESLKEQGIIKTGYKEGKKKYYRLSDPKPDTGPHTSKSIHGKIYQLFNEERNSYKLNDLPPHPINVLFNFRKKMMEKIEGLKYIILFGSAVKGSYGLGSDLDLYIVMENKSIEVEDQIFEVSEQYDHEFSLIFKSEEQCKREFSKPRAKLAKSILKEGNTLIYEDSEEFNKFIEEGES